MRNTDTNKIMMIVHSHGKKSDIKRYLFFVGDASADTGTMVTARKNASDMFIREMAKRRRAR